MDCCRRRCENPSAFSDAVCRNDRLRHCRRRSRRPVADWPRRRTRQHRNAVCVHRRLDRHDGAPRDRSAARPPVQGARDLAGGACGRGNIAVFDAGSAGRYVDQVCGVAGDWARDLCRVWGETKQVAGEGWPVTPGGGNPTMWLPFLNTYRTTCYAPSPISRAFWRKFETFGRHCNVSPWDDIDAELSGIEARRFSASPSPYDGRALWVPIPYRASLNLLLYSLVDT